MDGHTLVNVYFSLFTIIAIVCGLGVLSCKHPITGAISLIGVMLSLAGIYGLLGGVFLGIVQVLVYAGAIMMLVVFVIMVLNSAKEREATPSGWLGLLGVALGLALVATVGSVLWRLRPADDVAPAGIPSGERLLEYQESGAPPTTPVQIEDIGKQLFDFSEPQSWFVLFQAVGILLLVAMAGAVLLAKRSLIAKGVDA